MVMMIFSVGLGIQSTSVFPKLPTMNMIYVIMSKRNIIETKLKATQRHA